MVPIGSQSSERLRAARVSSCRTGWRRPATARACAWRREHEALHGRARREQEHLALGVARSPSHRGERPRGGSPERSTPAPRQQPRRTSRATLDDLLPRGPSPRRSRTHASAIAPSSRRFAAPLSSTENSHGACVGAGAVHAARNASSIALGGTGPGRTNGSILRAWIACSGDSRNRSSRAADQLRRLPRRRERREPPHDRRRHHRVLRHDEPLAAATRRRGPRWSPRARAPHGPSAREVDQRGIPAHPIATFTTPFLHGRGPNVVGDLRRPIDPDLPTRVSEPLRARVGFLREERHPSGARRRASTPAFATPTRAPSRRSRCRPARDHAASSRAPPRTRRPSPSSGTSRPSAFDTTFCGHREHVAGAKVLLARVEKHAGEVRHPAGSPGGLPRKRSRRAAVHDTSESATRASDSRSSSTHDRVGHATLTRGRRRDRERAVRCPSTTHAPRRSP